MAIMFLLTFRFIIYSIFFINIDRNILLDCWEDFFKYFLLGLFYIKKIL